MTGSIIQFPIRGVIADRPVARSRRTVSRISAAGRYGFYREKDYICKIPLPPLNIVIRWQAPATSESCAATCCNLTGLYLSRGFQAEIMNSFRALVPGNLLPRGLLKSVQESGSRVYVSLRESFRVWVLRHVSEHDIGVTQNDGTIVQERGFFSQGAGRV